MTPVSPIRLTTEAVDITMESTDHFFFEFEVGGLFTSPHDDGFHPHLPHNRSFEAGSMWPNRQEHPDGVKPLGNGIFSYTWTPNPGKPKPPTENSGTIHVGGVSSDS
jgi:hypothetical protein